MAAIMLNFIIINNNVIAQTGQSCLACTTITNTNTTYSSTIVCNGGTNIIINGGETLKLYRSTLQMSAGSKIIVKNGGTLNLAVCHIFGCNAMWQGIDVEPGGIVTTEASPENGNIIEDALIAIRYSFNDPLVILNDVYTGVPLLNLDNTIFNKNEIGLQFIGQQDGIAHPALNLENIFKIGNCIFTCRDIRFDATKPFDGGFGVDDLKVTTVTSATIYPATPAVYTAPFINYATFKDDVPNAFLKSPFMPSQAKSKIGIDLQNFFSGTNGTYIGFKNGSQLHNPTTIFDNQDIGVSAYFSQFTLHNCTFQKPNSHLNIVNGINAVGVYIKEQGLHPFIGSTPNVGATIETPANTPNNAFYDMAFAIRGYEIYNTEISNCDIQSNQSNNPATAPSYLVGEIGIFLELGVAENIKVINNNIYNTKFGVMINENSSHFDINPQMKINVNNNYIMQNNPNSTIAATDNFVLIGVYLGSSVNCTSNENTRMLNCQNNHLRGVQNGIVCNNWQGINTHIDFNKIDLALDPLNYSDEYYGIQLISGSPITDESITYDPNTGAPLSSIVGNTVINNIVIGNADNKNQIGIDAYAQWGTHFGCNSVAKLHHGFRFNDMNYSTKFFNNLIDKTNQFGYTLNFGYIGQQGYTAARGVGSCPSDNLWPESRADWWAVNTAIKHYKTYNIGSFPTKSRLFIRNTTDFNPNDNGFTNVSYGSFPSYQNTTNTGTNYLPYISGFLGDCERCNDNGSIIPIARAAAIQDADPALEEIANETIEVADDDADKRLYTMQQQLYELLQNKPELKLNNTALQQFVVNSQWTALDFIYYTGKYIAEGDVATANLLLSFWPQTNKELDQNYYQYYDWITTMKTTPNWQPSQTAVLALANKCPLKSGRIVYAARALYNSITHKANQFANNCDGVSLAARGAKKVEPKAIIEVAVYPNPSNGIVNINLPKTTVADAKNWFVTVTDMYGKTVINKQLTSSQNQLNIVGAKGFYFTTIINKATGKQIVNKIILQ